MVSATVTRIRAARESDAAACAAIYTPYVRDTAISFELTPPSPEQMWQRMSEAMTTHAWLVAESDGVVAGYAYGKAFAARAAYRWSCETSIYIDPGRRAEGLGRALYRELLDRLAARGYRSALAGMTLPNDASAALHRAMGYELVGTYRKVGWKNGTWHDVAWFQTELGDSAGVAADDEQAPPEPR